MANSLRNAAVNRLKLTNLAVTSINGLTGSVVLTSPDNTISIAISGQNILIEALGAPPTGLASGDLSGDYPGPNVKKIANNLLGPTTLIDGNVLLCDSISWNSTTVTGDVKIQPGGITEIGALKVTNAMLAGSIAASKLIQSDIVLAESQVTNLVSDLASKLSTSLASGNIIVGNVSGIAAAVAMSGDATITSTGVLTIANLAVSNAKIANATIDLTTKVTGILPNANTTATSANTISAIVARDGSGNFSANIITASLSGNAATASKWITARNLAGNSVDGSANVAFANKFIVQGTADTGLSAAQFLGALGTGIVKNTTTTGVLTIAAAASDYVAPSAYASANGLTMATARILGRTTAASGPAEEISIGSGLTLSAGTLTSTGLGGTVTSVSVVSANGFAGSVATATTTPAITISTSISGILKGNGTAISAASAGSDYEVPLTFSTGLTRLSNTITVNAFQSIVKLTNLTTNGFVKTSAGDGTLIVDTNTYALDSAVVHNTGDESIAGIKTFTSFPQIPQTNMVYLSATNGSDSASANGSVTSPYATIGYALTQITTASATNPFALFLSTGAYSQATFTLKPNISLICNNSTIGPAISTITMSLDSGFNSADSNTFIKDANFISTVNFAFDLTSKLSHSTVLLLDNVNRTASKPFNITGTALAAGPLNAPTYLLVRDSFNTIFNGTITADTTSLTNIFAQISNSTFVNFTCLNSSSTASSPTTCNITSSNFTALTLKASGSQTLTSTIYGMSKMPATWTIDGANSLVKMYNAFDTAPTLLNSATFAPTSLFSGIVKTSATTASTSITTGAIVSGGGIGVTGKAWIGGALNVTDTTDSVNTGTGSGIFSGGVAIAKNLYIGANVQLTGGTSKLTISSSSGNQGLDLATTDAYSNMRVIQNTTGGADKDIYIGFGSGSVSSTRLYSNNNQTLFVNAGNVIAGSGAHATNATNGFLYIPTSAGTPTGVPSTYTGMVAMSYDTTNNRLDIYNGAWKSSLFS